MSNSISFVHMYRCCMINIVFKSINLGSKQSKHNITIMVDNLMSQVILVTVVNHKFLPIHSTCNNLIGTVEPQLRTPLL